MGWGSGIRQTFIPLLLFLLRFSSQSHLCQSRELIPSLWSLVATLQISRHDNVPLLPPALARGSPSSVVTEIVRAAPLTADYPTLSVTAAPMVTAQAYNAVSTATPNYLIIDCLASSAATASVTASFAFSSMMITTALWSRFIRELSESFPVHNTEFRICLSTRMTGGEGELYLVSLPLFGSLLKLILLSTHQKTVRPLPSARFHLNQYATQPTVSQSVEEAGPSPWAGGQRSDKTYGSTRLLRTTVVSISGSTVES